MEAALPNPYLPYPVRIDQVVTETEDRNLKTFRFVFLDPEDEDEYVDEDGGMLDYEDRDTGVGSI